MSVAISYGLPLQLERMVGGKRKLLRDFFVKIGDRVVVVPKGSVTDFATIPWYGRWVVRFDEVDVPSVVHDYLIELAEQAEDYCQARKEADRVWRILAVDFVGEYKAWVGWLVLKWYSARKCLNKL